MPPRLLPLPLPPLLPLRRQRSPVPPPPQSPRIWVPEARQRLQCLHRRGLLSGCVSLLIFWSFFSLVCFEVIFFSFKKKLTSFLSNLFIENKTKKQSKPSSPTLARPRDQGRCCIINNSSNSRGQLPPRRPRFSPPPQTLAPAPPPPPLPSSRNSSRGRSEGSGPSSR